ncbi:MAG: Indole-3-glycerol phosphate synthase [Promethearchaeota archaeon]|nr:MAG: Indole-3-glycerol phosphate synthase [Candidatus Lokiarchaeota archaeon]
MMNTSNLINEIIKRRKASKDNDFNYYNSIAEDHIRAQREPLSNCIKKAKGTSIISEIKPASPTLGEIRRDLNIISIVNQMERAAVIGLSILTEPNYFKGSYENLKLAVDNSHLPCLLKDFIIDEIQLKIAQKLGATNVLLINSIIDISKFYPICLDYGLEPLIEIHAIEEIRDLEHLIEIGFRPTLVGVNNRDLKSLKIDLNHSIEIIPKLKNIFGSEVKVVSESGIKTREQIKYVQASGADAYLIGSSIMQSRNIFQKIKELRGNQ